jgi:hypothetical protein
MQKTSRNLDIPFGGVWTKFKNHFEIESNTNILFSGEFGIGKTSFLNFYLEEHHKEIINIRISPVNYSVSSNENIFELIKVDIIKQLYFLKFIDFDKTVNLSALQKVANYALKNPLNIVGHVSKALSKIHPLFEVANIGYEGVHELLNDFSNFEKKLQKEMKSHNQKLLDFVESKTLELGSYLEYNLISEILTKSIEKAKEKNLKIVLVVDDLDRLDPEHIFRILNILSSHHDLETGSHKFGFDKVILVCDLQNIEHIFLHKYGEQVDFGGYIDKFFSHEVFTFSNDDALDFYFENTLKTQLNHSASFVFKELLKILVSNKKLTVRQLIKHKIFTANSNFKLHAHKLDIHRTEDAGHIRSDDFWIESDDLQIIYIVKYFSVLFGSFRDAKKKLSECNPNISYKKYSDEEAIFLMEAFSLIMRYIELVDSEKDKIYYKRYGGTMRDSGGRAHKMNSILGWPDNTVFNIKHRIILGWNNGNPYNASKSYFNEYKVDPSNLDLSQIDRASILSNFNQIFQHIEKSVFKRELQIFS